MYLGRAAVLGVFSRKRKLEKLKNKQEKKPQQILRDHQRDFLKKLETQNYLLYKSRPIGAWFIGLFMSMTAVWLFYAITEYREYFDREEQLISVTWKYIVTFMIQFVGFQFIWQANIETIEINNKLKLIIQQRSNIFCSREADTRDLYKLDTIKIVKRGFETFSSNYLHYILLFTFDGEKDLEILESNSLLAAKKKYVEVMTYLNKTINFDVWIEVKDESKYTRTSSAKNKKDQVQEKPQSQAPQNQILTLEAPPKKRRGMGIEELFVLHRKNKTAPKYKEQQTINDRGEDESSRMLFDP